MSAVVVQQPPSLLAKIASRYSVEPSKMLSTLKGTAFRQREGEVTNEQMMALLIVADQHKLNPFTKEIYAFPDKNNGVVPVVGVDGWARIINEHPQFNGMEFVDGPNDKNGMPEWIECVMHRKDRTHPTRAREYMAECRRGTQPWQSHPRRMLRHKAMIQCARLAFSFSGIYDEDEAQRIAEATVVGGNTAVDALNAGIRETHKHQAEDAVIVVEPATNAEKIDAPPAPDTEAICLKIADFRAAVEAAETADEIADLMGRCAQIPGAMGLPEYTTLSDFAAGRIKAIGKAAKGK